VLFGENEPRALAELARVRVLAVRVRERFEAGDDAAEILRDVELLEAAHQTLEEVLPTGVSRGNLPRHIRFLGYYLKQNQPDNCRKDIVDVCQVDLPRLEAAIQDQAGDEDRHDAEFVEKIRPLLRDQHLDSAVRRAFVILKERLVEKFGLAPELDGSDLVNAVFGRRGVLAGQISDQELQAMRDLLSGLYGMFRNRYGHRDIEPSWFDAAAVLGMIDWALRTIEQYPFAAND
jgi:hypothetical protein